jgi:MoaA/NifB/PqqE/SkfB family radical SAM enzyme
MTLGDWRRVILDIATLGADAVQFIGGEPMMHPSLAELIRFSLAAGLAVEVFTSLSVVPAGVWDVLSLPGVRLATSYYSDDPAEHETITRGRGSDARTRANIEEARRRAIPVRVGLIDVHPGQRTGQARSELLTLGVTDIGQDKMRRVGRGAGRDAPTTAQLCGRCGRRTVAIASNGDAWPCVFARWVPLGNVRDVPLAQILTGSRMASFQTEMRSVRAAKKDPGGGKQDDKPKPEKCSPATQCRPATDNCQPDCPPSYHSDPERCWPYYYDDESR